MKASATTKPAGRISVDVAVCTFRRPHLAQTLQSLGRLALPASVEMRVIVADNDVEPSAKTIVEEAAADLPFPVLYIHCPASNISVARNACLDACDGDFLAFIDDDEVARKNWLSRHLDAALATNADVVLGPVCALYDSAAPAWMRRGDFHSTRPVWVTGEIRTGYTCNTLIRMTAPSLKDRRFNLALGRTGGEDTDFFTQAHRAGGRIAFAPDAWVEEPVPASRARLSWLAKRRFRSGQTHGRLLQEGRGWLTMTGNVVLALAKAGYCLAAAVILCFSRPRSMAYALRGVMHIGVVGGLLGVREIRQYGLTGARA